MPTIRLATTNDDLAQAAELFADYAAWIGAGAGIDPFAAQPALALDIAYPRRLSTPTSRLFVASIDGRHAGTVAVKRHTDGTAELKRLYVRPIARGRGFAGQLARRAVDQAELWGSSAIWLETLPGLMDPAVSLYQKLGFVRDVKSTATIATDGIVTMRRDLSSANRNRARANPAVHAAR